MVGGRGGGGVSLRVAQSFGEKCTSGASWAGSCCHSSQDWGAGRWVTSGGRVLSWQTQHEAEGAVHLSLQWGLPHHQGQPPPLPGLPAQALCGHRHDEGV